MNVTPTSALENELSWRKALGYALAAVASFHLAYRIDILGPLILVYVFCLVALSRLNSNRKAFYTGLAVGLACVAPELDCFFKIWGWAAVPLWMVLAFWIGLFLLLARQCRVRFGPVWGVLLIPFLWTGLEFFRSELYFLRFSWLNIGYAFAKGQSLFFIPWLGMYGVGFAAVFWTSQKWPRTRRQWSLVLIVLLAFCGWAGLREYFSKGDSSRPLHVAGLQLESVDETQIPGELDRLVARFPETQLVVLNEFCFGGPIPQPVRDWCRKNSRHLIAGGKVELGDTNFYNTAFVVDTNGAIVFQQVKSVPIQFFADGLPAPEQKLWDSPWGKLGICICYDLSFTRVTDRLVRLGAQALIVPTMDMVDWGRNQHELHARVAPVRAAEYGVPIVRVASSGVSQIVDAKGRVTALAPFSEKIEMIGGTIAIAGPGRLPPDRWLAPFAVLVTGMTTLSLLLRAMLGKISRSNKPKMNVTIPP